MTAGRTLAAAGLLVVAIVVALVLATRPDAPSVDASGEGSALASAATATAPEVEPRSADPAAAATNTERVDAKVPEATREILTHVLYEGAPAPGAEVRVLPVTADIAPLLEDAIGPPDDVIASATRWSTDEDGSVTLTAPDVTAIVTAWLPGAEPLVEVAEPEAEQITFSLTPGRVLAGTVTLPDGRPAVGAVVTARKDPYVERMYRQRKIHWRRLVGMFFRSEAVVDSAGRFEVGELDAGYHHVEARLDGYSRATVIDHLVPSYGDCHLTLHHGATLSGRVIERGSGAPIPRVRLTAFTSVGRGVIDPHQVVSTDDDGGFVLDGVRGGGEESVAVSAFREGRATEVVRLPALKVGERRSMVIELGPAVDITGEVTDTAGAPIKWAMVDVYDAATGEQVEHMMTPEDGRFSGRFVAPGRTYEVEIWNPYSIETLRVMATPPCPPIVVRMRPFGVVAGAVTADRAPVANGRARLEVRTSASLFIEHQWADLDSDGRYRFDGVPAGKHSLHVFADGFAPAFLGPIVIDPPRTDASSFDVDLDSGATLTGTVRDAGSRAPVVGAKVQLVSLEEVFDEPSARGRLPLEATTDAAGRYELGHAPVGRRFGLTVDAAEYGVPVHTLTIPDGALSAHLDVELSPGATLELTLVGDDGASRPTFHGTVFGGAVERRKTHAAKGGVCTFERLPSGPTHAGVFAPNADPSMVDLWMRQQVELVAGETTRVEFSLKDTGRIRGRITGAPIERELRRFSIAARDPEERTRHTRSTESNAQNEYVLDGLPSGRHLVTLASFDSGDRLLLRRLVDVVAGEETRLDFELGDLVIQGAIVDERGDPIMGAQFDARQDDIPGSHRAVSGVDGRFSLSGLHEGTWRYSARADGRAQLDGQVELVEGTTIEPLSLRLEPESILRVSVVDVAGAEVEHAAVVDCRPAAMPGAAGLRREGRDTRGRIVVRGARADEYVLHVRADGFFPERAVVRGIAGSDVDVTVTLRRPGTLDLRVLGRDGAPLRAVIPSVVDQQTGESARDWLRTSLVQTTPDGLRTDDSGRLRIDGLPEGAYRVEVAGMIRTVDVAPSGVVSVVMQEL